MGVSSRGSGSEVPVAASSSGFELFSRIAGSSSGLTLSGLVSLAFGFGLSGLIFCGSIGAAKMLRGRWQISRL